MTKNNSFKFNLNLESFIEQLNIRENMTIFHNNVMETMGLLCNELEKEDLNPSTITLKEYLNLFEYRTIKVYLYTLRIKKYFNNYIY
jgi:hypothetical protein